MDKIIYSDINPDDPFNQPLLENVPSVLSSLTNIFSTDKNARLFNLDITANLERLLFEPMTTEIANVIYVSIIRAVERFEPRVHLIKERCVVVPDYDNNRYYCSLEFQVLGITTTHDFKFVLPRSGS